MLTVFHVIDSLVAGGAERSLMAVAPALIGHGVDLHVGFLSPDPGLQAEMESIGVKLHSPGARGGRISNARWIAREVKALQPDLVHTTLFESDALGRPAARLSGVPVVSSFVGEQYGPEHLENPRYSKWKVRSAQLVDLMTARLARRFHAVSQGVADQMSRRLLVPRSRIVVIPRGRDPIVLGQRTAERSRRTRQALSIDTDRPVILGVGRQYHVKGFEVLIDAFDRVLGAEPDALLLIAGRPGPATGDLEQQIERLQLSESVQMLGYRDDVPDLLASADVFATASRSEGSPGAVIEAMALKAPIVATDIPAMRELLRGGGAAHTVAVDDRVGMADAIVDLIRDRPKGRRMSTLSYSRFKSAYTVDSVAKQTLDFYLEALS